MECVTMTIDEAGHERLPRQAMHVRIIRSWSNRLDTVLRIQRDPQPAPELPLVEKQVRLQVKNGQTALCPGVGTLSPISTGPTGTYGGANVGI